MAGPDGDVSDTPPRPDRAPGPASTDGGRAAAPTWRWWEGLLAYLVALLAGGAASFPVLRAVAPPGDAQILASIVADLAVLALLLLWLRRFHPSWGRAMGIPGRPGREAVAGALAGFVLYAVVALAVAPLLALALRAATGEVPELPRQLPARLTPLGVGGAVAFGLLVAPVQEELVFRGLLFRALRDRYGFSPAAWASGVAFGLVHYVPAASPADPALLMGAMVATGYGLALIYERRGNLLASIAAHAAFNLVGLAFLLTVRLR
ncbi:MAG TPA: CPBP family intramembrane glutamic endopeptidase [Actinomycetota bacterium]|nr:CPBP family intramembrane glutamic endopeptidase [Actinomycetota bacterium]